MLSSLETDRSRGHAVPSRALQYNVPVPIYVLAETATDTRIAGKCACYGDMIKLAVDVERGVLAGGGEYHADCEGMLLEAGSDQREIRGADWYPETSHVEFGALINIRPDRGNRDLEIVDQEIRMRVEGCVRALPAR